MTTRREFLAAGAAAGIAAADRSPIFSSILATTTPEESSSHPLRILILGGTSFLGPHQIAYALGRGHSISTFTRGRSQPPVHKELFSQVESLVGDRENNLDALRGREWDVVIDNSGRNVQWTIDTAELLKDSADLYLYTSSTGVFYPYDEAGLSEERQPLLEVPEGVGDGERGIYDYGVMKANSELAARRAFGDDRTIAVRPSYMIGPGDGTDRFTYWPVRLARGGEVLVPGPNDPVQYIDVRDVAEWMIRLAEQRVTGTFNAVGPGAPTTTLQFVHGAHAAFAEPATFVPVDDRDFLRANRLGAVIPWIMPVGGNAYTAEIDGSKAWAAGLTFRPLAQSCREIYEWWNTDAVPQERKDRMVSGPRSLIARESEILAAWHAR